MNKIEKLIMEFGKLSNEHKQKVIDLVECLSCKEVKRPKNQSNKVINDIIKAINE